MARKKGKDADSRAALLRAALELVEERGFEEMSVEAVATRAGLSKGTFFHFFPTKAALLDGVGDLLAREALAELRPLLEDPAHDPLARLRRFLAASRGWRGARARPLTALSAALTRDANVLLLLDLRARAAEVLAPALAALLAEGTARGQLGVEDPEATAQLLLEWMDASGDGGMRALAADPGPGGRAIVARRANAALLAFERVLGAAEGSLERIAAPEVSAFAQAAGLAEDAGRLEPDEQLETDSRRRLP